MDFNVIDKDGKWLVNTSVYRTPYAPEAVENQPAPRHVIFEPGVPVKVKPNEDMAKWLESQTLIVASPDPMTSDEPIPAVIVPAESTIVPKDDVTGKPDVASAPGIIKTAAQASAEAEAGTPAKKK